MSTTPQDIARSSYQQAISGRQSFQTQSSVGTPTQAQRNNASFRQNQASIRSQAHNSPYSTPYTPNAPQTGPPRQNGNNGMVSAEQQIAQGVLSVATNNGSGSNTPQRRPPPLGKQVHIPGMGSPQTQSLNINHTIAPNSASSQIHSFDMQRQSQNGSPSVQNMNGQQRSSINASPAANSPMHLGSRPQDNSPDDSMMDPTQDMSMIDPQLAIDQHALDQQLMDDANSAMMSQLDSTSENQVIQGEPLSAPPQGSYPTFEALFAAAQNHALAHGYAFVIGRSKRDNRGLKKVFLICDRGGNNKEKVPGEQRQRKTKSRKCGCEFGVFGLENKSAWLLRGRIDGEHLMHNHPPSESPTEHPGARKLDPKAIAAVKALEENGVSVKETLEILHRDNPNVRYLPRDIYNARAAIKRDPSRVEATAMEALPTFYKKPPMTFEEKLRAELRTEVASAQAEIERVKQEWQKEVEDLKEQLRLKDKQIEKFEMFIDICNERVMVQREKVFGGEGSGNPTG